MANITQVEVNGTTYDICDAVARDSLSQLPNRGIKSITRSGTTFTVTRDDNTTFTFTQQDNNSITGVKGNAESSYRTGNVNLTAANIGAAAASHGNHVPTTQTADNTKFLRNDNTWQKVTPANIGALASSLVKFTRCAGGIEFTTWDNGMQIDFYTNTTRTNGYAFSVSDGAISMYKLTNGSYSTLKSWS